MLKVPHNFGYYMFYISTAIMLFDMWFNIEVIHFFNIVL